MRGKTVYRRVLNSQGEWEEVEVYLLGTGNSLSEVTKAEYDAAFPDKPLGDFVVGNWRKPIHSENLAVNTSQIQELKDYLKARGDHTEIDAHGRPIITSTAHKRAHTKARGYTCRDHFY